MPQPNPIAFNLFGLDVRWYGVIIAASMLVSMLLMLARAPKRNIDKDNLFIVVIVSVIFGIVGARAYYVIFNWSMYAGNLSEIFNTRGGGLAIHGGLILAVIVSAFMCRLQKINYPDMLDLAAPCIALAQAIGRWGNYFNGEAHGTPTDFPISVIVGGQSYHATFLYESIWCLLLFIALSYVDSHRQFRGQVILLYAILYSLERFFVEALRTDSLMLGDFKQAQVLSLAIIVICAVAYIVLRGRQRKNSIY